MSRQLVLEIVCLLAVLFVKESFCKGLLPDTEQCGKSFENRMYGGSETQLGEHPWSALITLLSSNGKTYIYGGSLINTRYVLTSGRCMWDDIFKNNTNKTPIRLGEWNRATNPDCVKLQNGQTVCADPHVDVGVEEWIPHPDYDYNVKDSPHDMSLVRLDRYVGYTKFIQPICLPVQANLRVKKFYDKNMYMVGWGRTEKSPKETTQVKRKALVKGVSLDRCRSIWNVHGKTAVSDSHVCAVGAKGINACDGDFGGSLVSLEKAGKNEVYVLAGIVSFAVKPCNLYGYPVISSSVGADLKWILETLRA